MTTKRKRPGARRSFTDELKAGAVRLVLDEGKSVSQVARDLDLTASRSGRGTSAPLRPGLDLCEQEHQKLLAARGITCSMCRRGDCFDNAAMESWFSTLKC